MESSTTPSCFCDSSETTGDPTEYLEALKRKYLDRTAKLQAQQIELEKRIMQMEVFLGEKDNEENSADTITCSCEVVPKVFFEPPVRDDPGARGISSVGSEQKPVEQCSFFQKIMENARSILSIKCQCASAFVSAKSTNITPRDVTTSESAPAEAPTRESNQLKIDGDDTTLTEKSSKGSTCTCDESSSLQEVSCLCNIEEEKPKTFQKEQQVTTDPSSSLHKEHFQESRGPTSTSKSAGDGTTASPKSTMSGKNTICTDFSPSCSCEICACISSSVEEHVLDLENLDTNQITTVPKVAVFSGRGDNVAIEVQATASIRSKGLNIEIPKDTASKCVTCCCISSCRSSKKKRDANNHHEEIQVASRTENKAVNILVEKDNACVTCCKSLSCPSSKKIRCPAACNIGTDGQPARPNAATITGGVLVSRASSAANSSEPARMGPQYAKETQYQPGEPDGAHLKDGFKKCECPRQDGENQCAFIGSPLLHPQDFAIAARQTIGDKAARETPKGLRKGGQNRVFSLTSNEIIEMQNVADLAKLEKQMKAQIEDLQKREKAYQEASKDMKTLVSKTDTQLCSCEDAGKASNLQEEINKISKELRMENQILKTELMDMKYQLKHCLENIEGPMKQKLLVEKQKCEVFQQKLQDASKNMVLNQDTYSREMNQLKLQLCCACTNISELNQMNGRLKEEMEHLDCLCAKLEEDLLKQKINEADTIKRLTHRRFSGDGPHMHQSEEIRCDSNLEDIARNLSQTLKELTPCEECSKLPPELAGAARCIKELTDMVIRRRRERSSSVNGCCCCKSEHPLKQPSEVECCCLCDGPGGKKEPAKAIKKTTTPSQLRDCTCQSGITSKLSVRISEGKKCTLCAPKHGGGEPDRIKTSDEKTVKTLLSAQDSFAQKGDSSKFEVDAAASSYHTARGAPVRDTHSLAICAAPCAESKGTSTKGELPPTSRDVGEPHEKDKETKLDATTEVSKTVSDKGCKAPCSGMFPPGIDKEVDFSPRPKEKETGQVATERGAKGRSVHGTTEEDTSELPPFEVPVRIDCQCARCDCAFCNKKGQVATERGAKGRSVHATTEEDTSELPPFEVPVRIDCQCARCDCAFCNKKETDKSFEKKASASSSLRKEISYIPYEIVDQLPDTPQRKSQPVKKKGSASSSLQKEIAYIPHEIVDQLPDTPQGMPEQPSQKKAQITAESSKQMSEFRSAVGPPSTEAAYKTEREDRFAMSESYTSPAKKVESVGCDCDSADEVYEEAEEYKHKYKDREHQYEKREHQYGEREHQYEEQKHKYDEQPKLRKLLAAEEELPADSVKTEGKEIPFEEDRFGDFPVDVENRAFALDEPPVGLHVTTTITGSGTLEVITEGPGGTIETMMTYTDEGNIEVVTELIEYMDDQKISGTEQALDKYATEPRSNLGAPQKAYYPMKKTLDSHIAGTDTKLKPMFPVDSSNISGPSGPEVETSYTPSTVTGEGDLTSKLSSASSGIKKALGATPDLTTSVRESSRSVKVEGGKMTPQSSVSAAKEQQPVTVSSGTESEVKHTKSAGETNPSAQDAVRQDMERHSEGVTSEAVTSTGVEMPSGEVFTPDQVLSEIDEELPGHQAEIVAHATPKQGLATPKGSTPTAFKDDLRAVKDSTQSIPHQDLATPEKGSTQIIPKADAVHRWASQETESNASIRGSDDPEVDHYLKEIIESKHGGHIGEAEVTIQPLAGAAMGPVEEISPGEIKSETDKARLPGTSSTGARKTRDCSCQSKDQKDQSCQCCECKTIGVTTSGDKETITAENEEMCKTPQEEVKTDTDSEFVTTSETTENVFAQRSDSKKSGEVSKTVKPRDWVQIDDEILKKHPELAGKTSKEQEKILENLGILTPKGRLLQASVQVDDELIKKHPELAGKTSKEQEKILENLGILTPKSRLLQASVQIDNEMLKKHPELAGKTSKEQEKILENLGILTPKDRLLQASVQIDDEMLKKHPELAGKTSKEQEKILENLGILKPQDRLLQASVQIDDELLKKHPELAGKTSKEQAKILENLGILTPKDRLLQASVQIDDELIKKHPELAGKTSKEQEKILENLGILTPKGRLLQASVQIDDEMLKKHPELAGKTSKEQEKILENLGILTPQDRLLQASVQIDDKLLKKHPELAGKTSKEQAKILENLGILTPKDRLLQASVQIDDELIKKHPELAGKTSKEQEKILENLGILTPKGRLLQASVQIDDEMLKKHPELAGKTSKEQEKILENLGILTHKSRLLQALVQIDDEMLKKHPELAGKTSKEQEKILENLGILTPKSRLLQASVQIDDEMLKNHPELAGKTSKEQEKILENLGILIPKDRLLQASVQIDDEMLKKHPELAGKTSEEQEKILENLGILTPKSRLLQASVQIDDEMLKKHPELAGKTSKEQEKILENLGILIPKDRLLQASVQLDDEMLKKYPELAGKTSKEQEKILENLGILIPKDRLLQASVQIDDEMLKKHPELAGKTSKEQEKILENLGILTPKGRLLQALLTKYPELEKKSLEEQKRFLKEKGYSESFFDSEILNKPSKVTSSIADQKIGQTHSVRSCKSSCSATPKTSAHFDMAANSVEMRSEILENTTSAVIDPNLLKKHPELNGKSSEQQIQILENLGYVNPKSTLLVNEQLTKRSQLTCKSSGILKCTESTKSITVNQEILEKHPELTGKTADEQKRILVNLGYKPSNLQVYFKESDAKVDKPQPSSKEVSITCKASCRTAATIHDDSTKDSEKDFTTGESCASVTKSKSVSLQQKPSSKDGSALCKASCRTVSVQNYGCKAALNERKIEVVENVRNESTTTTSSSDGREKEKSKRKEKIKSKPGEVPLIVSQLSDKERPVIETTKKSKAQRKKRSTRIMDCLKCNCPDPCNCEVCLTEKMDRRQRTVGRPVRSCDCPPNTMMPPMQLAYSMPIPSHVSGCSCNQCIFELTCRPNIMGRSMPEGESPTSEENDVMGVRKHSSKCECVDCLCLPKIKKLAETKEYPVIYDRKQVYHIKTKCGTCDNAQNAKKYIEQLRSRIPISTSTSNPPKVKSDSKQAISTSQDQKLPISNKPSHADSIYSSVACDCEECRCTDCPDKIHHRSTNDKKDIYDLDCCCNETPCTCKPCTFGQLTQKLKETEAKLEAAQRKEAAQKLIVSKPSEISGDKEEECTCPECVCLGSTTAPLDQQKSGKIVGHPSDCECPTCSCPGLGKDGPQTHPESGDSGHPSDCDCLTCSCPGLGKDGSPTYSEPGGSGHPLDCDCLTCSCPGLGKDGSHTHPEPDGSGHPSDCDCPTCSCPGLGKDGSQAHPKPGGRAITDDSHTHPEPGEICNCPVCVCCSPCSKKKGELEAKISEEVDKCDCVDCKCNPCADPRMHKDNIPAQRKLMDKGVEVRLKESAISGEGCLEMPKKIPHPPGCDCDECKCLEEMIENEINRGGLVLNEIVLPPHPPDCDCDRCLCPGFADLAVQPTADKEVHPADCTCDICKCPGATADKEVHPANCTCDICKCPDDTVLGPQFRSIQDKEVHPADCTCDECQCPSSLDKPVHAINCACSDCLCPECTTESAHVSGCRCDECICKSCDFKNLEGTATTGVAKMRAIGAGEDHPFDCSCIRCICDKCTDTSKHQSRKEDHGAAKDKIQYHSEGCRCVECLCKECLLKLEPIKHEEGCKCAQCTCIECLREISVGDKVGDAGPKGRHMEAPPEGEVTGEQGLKGDNCVCQTCICIDCNKKSTGQKEGGPAMRMVEDQAAHSETCTCTVCKCDPCTKLGSKDGSPKQRKIGTGDIAHPDTCDCSSCKCEPCNMVGLKDEGPKQRKIETGDIAHPDICDCSLCKCEPCYMKGSKDEGPKQRMIGTGDAVHPGGCTCVICICDPCPKKTADADQPCTCSVCTCIECTKKRGIGFTNKETIKQRKIGTGNAGHPGNCTCTKCICDPCSQTTADQPCACSVCTCIECTKKRGIGITNKETIKQRKIGTGNAGHPGNCTCTICICDPCSQTTADADQPCACSVCTCIECTKKRETRAILDTTKSPGPRQLQSKTEEECDCPSVCTCDGADSVLQGSKKNNECNCKPVCTCPGTKNAESAGISLVDPPPFEPPQRIDCDCNKCDCVICALKKGQVATGRGAKGRSVHATTKEDTSEPPPFEIPVRIDCQCARCDCAFCNKKGPSRKEVAAQQSRGLTAARLVAEARTVSVQPSRTGDKPPGCDCDQCVCSIEDLTTTKSSGIKQHKSGVDQQQSAMTQKESAMSQQRSGFHQQRSVQPMQPLDNPVHCDCPTCTCNEGEIQSTTFTSGGPSIAARSAAGRSAVEDAQSVETLELPKPTLEAHMTKIHPVPCDCPECICQPCPDPHVTDTVGKMRSVKQMDDVTLVTSLQVANKENCECKEQIEEIKKTLEKIKCACTEAEFRGTRSMAQTMGQTMDMVPGKPFIKTASVFGQTMSGLKMALNNLQAKCKAKDKMIEAMTGELEIRADPDIFEKVLDRALKPTKALDYDQSEDVKSMERSQIVTRVLYGHKTSEQGTAPCNLKCVASKAVEVRTHKHKKKRDKADSARKLDCSCSKPQIVQKEEKDCQKLDLSGFEVIDIRRITDDSLIVKWNAPKCDQVTGYDIFVNGTLASKVMSGTRTSAMMHSLDLSKSVQITIYAVSKCGRIEPPAIAIYEIKS